MNRRSLFGFLPAIPLLGALICREVVKEPSQTPKSVHVNGVLMAPHIDYELTNAGIQFEFVVKGTGSSPDVLHIEVDGTDKWMITNRRYPAGDTVPFKLFS